MKRFSLLVFGVAALLATTAVLAQTGDARSVTVTASSANAGFDAWRAMDGDPATMWHTQFSAPVAGAGARPHPFNCGYAYACGYDHGSPTSQAGQNNQPHPHSLHIDLGEEFTITGIVYTPREGEANGTIKKYRIYVGDDATCTEHAATTPAATGEFPSGTPPYRVEFASPVRGRCVTIVADSEQHGHPFASVAELTILNKENVSFVATRDEVSTDRIPNVANDPALQERIDEWNIITARLATPAYWEAIADEVESTASLILPTDRDPLDVLLRRVGALVADLGSGAEQLRDLRAEADAIPVSEREARFIVFRQLADLRREKMFASPLVQEVKSLLFVKRHRSTFEHMCDQFYGSTQRPGGGLFVVTKPFDDANRGVINLLANQKETLAGGSFLSPDLSFDGTQIAFAYVACEGSPEHISTLDVTRGHWNEGQCYHLFTCDIDGKNLRQITEGTWNDFDPCWLPNGRIAFISERRNGYLRCGRECPTYTLFDVNADGSQMRCLSYHETNEWNPSVTNDGKIIYTRWDYVDRYGCIVHHPWTTTLDGRDPRSVHGNFSHRHRRADCEMDCRAIPNSSKFVAAGTPHHGQSFGSLVLVDPEANDDDAMGPTKRITPDIGFPESQGGGQVYGTPWALSDKYFLCVADFAYQPGGGISGAPDGRGNYGIYLVDVFGNRELVYRDPAISSISPRPIAPRELPHTIPSVVDRADIVHQPFVGVRDMSRQDAMGTLSVVNVYDSLRPFPDGTVIKKLRIIQLLPMSVPSGAPPHHTGIQEGSSLDSVNLARCVLGTVPVEDDGSAHFVIPAQVEFQFQAIDEDGLAVQSMRSSSYVQPGENLSCNGCHEPRWKAPQRRDVTPKAMLRAASNIEPETVPGANPFSFPLLVQPILDKHCVACHEKPESKTFSLQREPIVRNFYTSYMNLAPKYGFTNYGDPLRTIPGKFGARVAPLYKILTDGHYDVKLSADEMHRIVLWLDCISNFYGVYEAEGGAAQRRGEVARPTLE
ncbi:MAG: discoidin domain-containing protein [Thermoguttaceae bacterium]